MNNRKLYSSRWAIGMFVMTAVVSVCVSLSARQTQPATLALPALSPAQDAQVEAHLLRVENAQLRAALARLQAELDTLRLSAERDALLEQLRREVGAPADATFDWQSRRFTLSSQEPKP